MELVRSKAREQVIEPRVSSLREEKENSMNRRSLVACLLGALVGLAALPARGQTRAPAEPPTAYAIQEGFVDAHGVLIYYKTVGRGAPLVIVHGGPGASHDYFLPYLLPLARHNRLIFIDERGSGRSQKLENPAGYTVENMVEDVEAVRQGLQLGKIALLGHSYGGVLAQAYAFKYPRNLTHLLLCSTFHSTRAMNQVLNRIKEKMTPELRERIDRMEKEGLFGHGKDYEKNRYTAEYMIAAWGEGYLPYLYQNRPDANFDPVAQGNMAWDLYREMWGSHGEYVIDGNLASVEYADRLVAIRVPTLITAGDHDESDPALAREMHEKIAGSRLVIFPRSGHMTFVDQPALFLRAVEEFLHPAKPPR
jgi:proline iminopeptidase